MRFSVGSSFWFTHGLPSAVRSKNSVPSSYCGSMLTCTKPLVTDTCPPVPVTGAPHASSSMIRMCVPLIGVAHVE
jgi:hypothetical protein